MDDKFINTCNFSSLSGRPCPLLTNIKNGYVEMGCRVGIPRYGKTCFHSCNGGYNLKGNINRECLANGTWSGTEPTCEKVHPSKCTKPFTLLPETALGKLPLISPGHIQLLEASSWAFKRRGFYPKAVITAIRTISKRAIGAHVDRKELRVSSPSW